MFVSRASCTSFSVPLSAAGLLPFPALLLTFFRQLLRTRSVLTILCNFFPHSLPPSRRPPLSSPARYYVPSPPSCTTPRAPSSLLADTLQSSTEPAGRRCNFTSSLQPCRSSRTFSPSSSRFSPPPAPPTSLPGPPFCRWQAAAQQRLGVHSLLTERGVSPLLAVWSTFAPLASSSVTNSKCP